MLATCAMDACGAKCRSGLEPVKASEHLTEYWGLLEACGRKQAQEQDFSLVLVFGKSR